MPVLVVHVLHIVTRRRVEGSRGLGGEDALAHHVLERNYMTKVRKPTRKQLKVKVETVKVLCAADLRAVVGGGPNCDHSVRCNGTRLLTY